MTRYTAHIVDHYAALSAAAKIDGKPTSESQRLWQLAHAVSMEGTVWDNSAQYRASSWANDRDA
jgi:hypothetical protein